MFSEGDYTTIAQPLTRYDNFCIPILCAGWMAAANALNNLARAAIGIGAGVSLFQSSVYNVDGGFRAVMFDRLRGVQVLAIKRFVACCLPFFESSPK